MVTREAWRTLAAAGAGAMASPTLITSTAGGAFSRSLEQEQALW